MNFLTNLLGVAGSGFNSLFGLVTSTMQKGFQAAIQFHKEGIAFARDVGLSAKQAQAYTEALTKSTQVLANKYGVSAEAIAQVQRGLSEATGKQLMLNEAQRESFVQIDKLMGTQARSKFTEEIMNGMGGQIETVKKAMANVYATAAKNGLVAKNLSDKVAQNLGMVNRMAFRDGVNGLTRMAALSEKLGINMQSVETAAGQFMDLDQAIQNAAQMQMLGGSAAANFGNPLTAAFEANYDPEAFAQRMSDSLASYAEFDASKGIASINGMNMDYVRNIAKTMGISVEDASKMAKKQAEVKYKENAFGGQLDAIAGGSEARRNYILNNSQLNPETGTLQIQGRDIDEFTEEDWQNMMAFEGMDDSEIMKVQAEKLTSIDEQLKGSGDAVAAGFAEGLNAHIPDIQSKIQELGEYMTGWSKQWGESTGKVVGEAMEWINQNGDTIRNIADGVLKGVTWLVDFFSNHWKELLVAIAGWKLLVKPLLGGAMSNVGAKAGTSILKNLGPKASTGVKIGSAAIGIGLGAYNAISSYNDYKDKKQALNEQLNSGAISKAEYNNQLNEARQEKNAGVGEGVGTAIGATIGTFIGGPIGTAIGGWLGGMGGKIIGENWDDICEWFKGVWQGVVNVFKGVGNWFKEKWNGVTKWFSSIDWGKVGMNIVTIFMPPVRGIIELVKHWDEVKEWFKGVWDGAIGSIKQVFSNIGDWFKDVWNGVVGVFNGVGNWFKDAWNGAVGVFTGVGNWFKEVWDGAVGVFQKVGNWIKEKWEGIMGLWDKVVDGFKRFIEDPWGTLKEGAKNVAEGAKNWAKDKAKAVGEWFGFAEGGIVPDIGNGTGDTVPAMLSPGERVIPKGEVFAKPVGEKEYIYVPTNTNTSNVNGNTIKVNDVNLHLNGTLKLDAGNATKDLDLTEIAKAIENDYRVRSAFVSALSEAFNRNQNGGRFMNDLATMQAQVQPRSI